jgi:hypothetical protein
MEPLPQLLARRRLTDFFEGAGQEGRRETVRALLRGRRYVVLLLWMLCQGLISLFLLAAPVQASLLDRTLGPVAISLVLGACCGGVLWKDWLAWRSLPQAHLLEQAFRRARDRSVSRLAIFSLSLVVGGALAMLCSKYAAPLG